MAKVKIQGHASGTGVLTVTAPNTSTDRTITLPDATGTLLNSDGSAASLTAIPAANITGTLPAISGANLTGVGISEIDKWVLTVDKTDSSVVSANLERAGSTFGLVTLKGTGMTQSSGVFSFPSTGYWMVTANCIFVVADGDNVGLFIDVTDDNSTWETQLVNTWQSNKSTGDNTATTGSSVSEIIKVENVSLDKVRFSLTSVASGTRLGGGTAYENTTFVFVKLGAL